MIHPTTMQPRHDARRRSATRHDDRRTLLTLAVAFLGALPAAAGCSASDKSQATEHDASVGANDASMRVDARGGHDAPIATDALRESGPVHDAAFADAGFPLYGDRHLGTIASYPAAALVQNGGRVIDVKNPPPALPNPAKGDGTTDDTAALQDVYDFIKAAFVDSGTADQNPYWIYLPDGTYKVSSTIIYRGASLEPDAGYDWYDVTQVRFVGQSREGTVLQLVDDAAAFQDPTHPSYVLPFQHPNTRFNNIPAANLLENLTIDTGHGNAGAIGLMFQGANMSVLTNVTVRSGDGAGVCGIALPIGSVQGAYHDITVQGFGQGICQTQNSEVAESFEHITLEGQTTTAAYVSGGGFVLRAAEVDETTSSAQALILDQAGSQATVVDSQLKGTSGVTAISMTMKGAEALFARNVDVTGFSTSIVKGDASAATGDVSEYLSDKIVTLSAGQPTHSMPLPVEDTPIVPWFDPTQDWANVADYGAMGDGVTDDSVAVQAAFNSGHPVVYFPKQLYYVTKTIHVPASLQRVDGMYATVCTSPMTDTTTCHTPGGDFNVAIDTPSTTPVLLRGFGGYGGATLSVARDVILQYRSGGFANTSTTPVHVYLENVANIGAGDAFSIAGQTTFARGLNDEQGGGPSADMQVNGGSLWVLNFKTENKPVSVLSATNGAFVEVLGGYNNVTVAPGTTPLIVNAGANVSFTGFTNFSCSEVETAIQEGQDAGAVTLLPANLPSRGYDGCYVIPLYVGYQSGL